MRNVGSRHPSLIPRQGEPTQPQRPTSPVRVSPASVRRVRPRAVCMGNLFRDQLDRYGELELVAERWRSAVHELDAAARLVVNGDDPQLGALAEERAGTIVFGVDDPRHSLPSLQHAADTKWCVRCGTPYVYAA